MGRGHGDRLGVNDATFLRVETSTEHMHTAGLFLFDAPRHGDFEFSRFIDLIRSRLHLVPRFRQKLTSAPMNLTTPFWVDDQHFDLAYHVRHAALPEPGGIPELCEYVARLISRPLDRSRPLWEVYVIEGLEDGGVAYLGKTHHAMIDGVTGIDIATLLLDFDEETGDLPEPRRWHPSPPPSDLTLAVRAVREGLAGRNAVMRSVRRLASGPREALSTVLEVGDGLLSMATGGVSPAPASPLNRPIGAHRRFAIQRLKLDEFRRVKSAFDTTVNDVVLAVTADALGRFLRGRGQKTRGLVLKAMVPVSVLDEDDDHIFGGRVSSVFVRLPVDEMDPVERLRTIHDEMKGLKDHKQALGAEFLVGLSAYAPSTLHALAARTAARARLFNFVLANVPGPQVPLYSLGMRLMGAFPAMPLPQNHALAIGLTSIDGWMNFGFTGDWDHMPDLENVTAQTAEALAELVKHAEAVGVRHELALRDAPRDQD
jgi:diacylglycerol O-acyltransferase / wax synthase